MNLIIYDCEIKKAIQGRNEERIPDVEYCDGWRDFTGMGISVIAAYDVNRQQTRVFCDDNFWEFKALVDNQENRLLGFNNWKFDDELVKTIGVELPKERSLDLLRKIWQANRLDPDNFNPRTHGGYGLDACAQINLGIGKSGSGAFAPVLWQRGRIGQVIDYCIRDVMLTYQLYIRAKQGIFTDPKTGRVIDLKIEEC